MRIQEPLEIKLSLQTRNSSITIARRVVCGVWYFMTDKTPMKVLPVLCDTALYNRKVHRDNNS